MVACFSRLSFAQTQSIMHVKNTENMEERISTLSDSQSYYTSVWEMVRFLTDRIWSDQKNTSLNGKQKKTGHGKNRFKKLLIETLIEVFLSSDSVTQLMHKSRELPGAWITITIL